MNNNRECWPKPRDIVVHPNSPLIPERHSHRPVKSAYKRAPPWATRGGEAIGGVRVTSIYFHPAAGVRRVSESFSQLRLTADGKSLIPGQSTRRSYTRESQSELSRRATNIIRREQENNRVLTTAMVTTPLYV